MLAEGVQVRTCETLEGSEKIARRTCETAAKSERVARRTLDQGLLPRRHRGRQGKRDKSAQNRPALPIRCRRKATPAANKRLRSLNATPDILFKLRHGIEHLLEPVRKPLPLLLGVLVLLLRGSECVGSTQGATERVRVETTRGRITSSSSMQQCGVHISSKTRIWGGAKYAPLSSHNDKTFWGGTYVLLLLPPVRIAGVRSTPAGTAAARSLAGAV